MSTPHALLSHPFSLTLPHRLTEVSSWHEHLPFAFALVAATRPRVLVELGTHRGDSYCGFCQVVEGLALATACYAVDTWQGDEHAGRYGEEIYTGLRDYHDARYGRFSRLIRSTFDEAREHFPDGSIDLLHIDGLHTRDAVAHDFESWTAKLSDRAVVVFHDINVRERGFGVWRYWEEISARFPSFAFVHGHGLGLVAVGKNAPAEILELCALAEAGRSVVRERFSALGSRVALVGQLNQLAQRLREADVGGSAAQEQRNQLRRELGQVREETDRRLELERVRQEAERRLEQERVRLEAERRLELVRLKELERRLAAATAESSQRGDRVQRLEASRAELHQRVIAADENARTLQERIQKGEEALQETRLELGRLGALIVESHRGWLDRVFGWVRKNNHIRLARRKSRRGFPGPGAIPWPELPASTVVTGFGPIAQFRRWNRGRLARRKARFQGPGVLAPVIRAADRGVLLSPPPTPLPATLAPLMHVPAMAAIPLGLVPATNEEAWGAYPRLKEEFRQLRATRHATFEATRCDLIQAPGDLTVFTGGLSLPAATSPRVSIIVPVFNHLRETLECIASVARYTAPGDYELIVVDDGSSDQTAALLPRIGNLRYFKNDTNGGFIVSCTRGAKEARGAYLVFLNNDAQVTAGWLPPLLETFTSFERVGAVGPKVLYPSGHLQEAGSMINPDLSISMVGLDDDPAKARYGYPREVHYCSGACVMVPRLSFEDVGGFSAELKPAYYEDCDLQLKLRARGLRTIYQPASVVVHHLSRTREGLPDPSGYKARQIARNSQWMREAWGDAIDAMHAVRLIAFYLPQFHPIRENELWWGKGFTEWTNVAKALPIFERHEQPHLPTDLGFYDLRLPEVMEEQARLAKAYGISGFCYYYYWFNGKRLLEAPIERLLTEPSAAMPFCLCWANENWTRRWDGGDGESEVLMGQAHSDEDDEAVILDLIRFLRHPSYIRINGRPMLLVYRVGLFPDIFRTTALWREVCRREGIGEIHLVRVDSFEDARRSTPPGQHGFDAAVEFPPHECGVPLAKDPQVREGFQGHLHDYEGLALQSARYKDAGYLHYRSAIPRWDNTARRPDSSSIMVNSSPGAYQAYLEEVLRYTREQNVGDDRLVFINAWNEWAEGAHLEPERRYGRTFLEATRNALGEHLITGGA